MNFRSKKLLRTLQVIFGLFMLFSGVSGLLMTPSMEGVPSAMVALDTALRGAGIFHLAKLVEIVVGALFLFNYLPALATLMLTPLAIGILVINVVVFPTGLPLAVLVVLFNAYFVYVYMKKYEGLLIK